MCKASHLGGLIVIIVVVVVKGQKQSPILLLRLRTISINLDTFLKSLSGDYIFF